MRVNLAVIVFVKIPFAFQKCEESGRIDNFERAAAALKEEPLQNTKPPGYPFNDSDPYKVIEGACYTLSVTARALNDLSKKTR